MLKIEKNVWHPIEDFPEELKDGEKLFDLYWSGNGRRAADCHFGNGVFKQKHSYPALVRVFLDPPTHFMIPELPAVQMEKVGECYSHDWHH